MSFSEEWRSDTNPTTIAAIGAVGADLVQWWYLGYGDGAWATFLSTSPSGRLLVFDGATGASNADNRGLWLDNGAPGDPTNDVLFRQNIFLTHAHVKFLPSTLEVWPTAGVTINHVYLFDQELDVSGGYPLTIPASFFRGPTPPGTSFPGLACNSTPPFTTFLGRPPMVLAFDTIGAPLGSVGLAWRLVVNGTGCTHGYGGWEQ
jgi:hypothetical protein